MIHTAWAADAFVVKNIQVEGSQGLSNATILSYLPVKVGQTLQPSDTPKIISALYATGFFSNVSLSQSGSTLVVHVSELPVISKIKVVGNSAIKTEEINKVFKDLGLVQGQVLDPAVLSQVVKSLRGGYDLQGHYNAIVTPEVVSTTRNRVNVTINISEGRVALVRDIHIIGNKAFSESTLIDTLKLTTWKWDSIITHNDHYSRGAFDQSLGQLTDYYLNRGYLRFKIDSANAVLSHDRKSVDLIIHVTEGQPFRLTSVGFSGTLILPEATYRNLPAVQALKPGSIVSKEKILAASKAVSYALGDEGYAFAKINAVPNIDDAKHEVSLMFNIVPGRKVYVRHISFTGNTASSDTVLRQSMRQSEGALSSIANIDESKRQLNLLGYFQDVKETAVSVPGSSNEVDLHYSVSEQPSAQATVGAGYGTDGIILSAGVNENNFLGTGRQVGVNFSKSYYQQSYSVSYNNPYYTPSGVQRGFTLFNTKTTPGNVNLAAYEFSSYGGNVNYSIPFTEKDSYQIGFGVQRTHLTPGGFPSTQILRFVQMEGTEFNQFILSGGWTRDSRNRAFFPTQGTYQNIGIQVSTPISGRALDYYKATYLVHNYEPIGGFTTFLSGTAGYGGAYGKTQGLPFFTNYYAGGLVGNGEVRGYQTNTLGPKDSTAAPIGGNVLLAGTVELLFPHPLSGTSFRTGVFVDAGNVYSTWNNYNTYPSSQTGVKLGDLRYSTGVDIQWKLPVLNAILEVALSKALNPKSGDLVEPFSFNIGGNF
ncbi:MAG TPA: outer membrane protein assembly factor BamA [Gammaproteobacteria bacterium]|nr:outer membrane protein assembly factor BamA [Gammaproteobacteria bacterium]